MTIKSQPVLPYSNSALQWDLRRVRYVWRKIQQNHNRFSVYRYLTAVFNLVMVWEKENCAGERACRTLGAIAQDPTVEPFAAVIRRTSSSKIVDSKMRSKWAHVLMFAAKYKSPAVPLDEFIQGFGGINSCASELSRLSRRKRPAK